MKRSHFAILTLITVLSLSACKRDYVCNCTGSWTNQKYDETIKAKNKAEAKSKCEGMNSPEVDGPYDCHLK